MSVKRVIKGVHLVPMGMANAYLVEGDDGLTLDRRWLPRQAGSRLRCDPRAGPFAGSTQAPDFHSRPPRSHRKRRCDRPGNRCEDLHAPARYPYGREWRPFSAFKAGTWFVAASAVQPGLPSQRAAGADRHQPAFDRRGNTAHRWRLRSYSYSRALRGTGRATVASGTNAVCRRRVHEHQGPW